MTGTDPLYTSDFTCHNKLSRVEAIRTVEKKHRRNVLGLSNMESCSLREKFHNL